MIVEITPEIKIPIDEVFFVCRKYDFGVDENTVEMIGLKWYSSSNENYFFQVSPLNLFNRFTEKEIRENFTHLKLIKDEKEANNAS